MAKFEEAKGKMKEAAGDLAENPDLEREGQAQADKGQAERQADEARAEARGHEHEASEANQVEQSAQTGK